MNRTITISLDDGTHSVIAINRLIIGHVSDKYDNFYSLQATFRRVYGKM